MSQFDFVQEVEPFGKWSQGLGLGIEAEQIQRAAKAQIMNHIKSITEQLQNIWDKRDEEFAHLTNIQFKKINIPLVDSKNFYTGTKHISVLKAPLQQWPSVIVYSSDAKPYLVQEDQWDTYSIPLCIEVLCYGGPIKNESELHARPGWIIEQELDSKVQRLSDVVHLCIRKDPSLGGVIGEIEKPPNAITSLPWSRKEQGTTGVGNFYIFQGKQLEYIVQKHSY